MTAKVTGERRYSFDLPQGGLEIPVEIIYKSEKKELIHEMKEKKLDEIKKYDKRRKKEWKIVWKKSKIKVKSNKNFLCIFFPRI